MKLRYGTASVSRVEKGLKLSVIEFGGMGDGVVHAYVLDKRC